MNSISLTPMTVASTLQQPVNQGPRSATPSLQQQQDILLSNIEKSELALKEIDNIDIIPILFELIENVKLGVISPKDFDNAAGRLRVRISRLKLLLNSIDGLNESHEDKISRINELNEKYEKKKQFFSQFKQSALDKLESQHSDEDTKLQTSDVEMT